MKHFIKNLDERNLGVIQKVSAIMYFINVMIIAGILIYRQFVLGQNTEQFMDIANLLVFNVIVAIAAILYLGGIPFPRIKVKTILLIYVIFVTIGFLFTLFKYAVLQNNPLSFTESLDALLIILVICGLFMFIYGLFAYLGSKKLEKDIS